MFTTLIISDISFNADMAEAVSTTAAGRRELVHTYLLHIKKFPRNLRLLGHKMLYSIKVRDTGASAIHTSAMCHIYVFVKTIILQPFLLTMTAEFRSYFFFRSNSLDFLDFADNLR